MTDRAILHRWDDSPLDRVTEMAARKALHGRGWSMTQMYLKKGALSPAHAHDGPQVIYVLQGAIAVTIGGAMTIAAEGQIVDVPAGVIHQTEAMDDSSVLSYIQNSTPN